MHRIFSNTLWARIKGLLPRDLRDAGVRLLMFSDRDSRTAFRHAHEASGLVSVRLRALGGKSVSIRRGTDDPGILRETFTWSDQLPPGDIRPRLIVDVGANIGASMALLASRFPEAEIVGLEPDPENAQLCRANTAPWASRCHVIEAAAWPEDGRVQLARRSTSTHKVDAVGLEVEAMSLSTLVSRCGHIDYMKVDIEGGERSLLGANTQWADSVSCINVEVHQPYSPEECREDLARLGFDTSLKRALRQPRVIGRRP